eukprot:TRINITY_DN112039_c0_g1_i1.p1 TRINITY_DN112039_c0_g1~~TRINITY_DN112039_c0_g1_i1.p1  ORF type:complete len:191 (-),score=27.20 TRINITY_DN112039_c0_g1_i1:344-916(-)
MAVRRRLTVVMVALPLLLWVSRFSRSVVSFVMAPAQSRRISLSAGLLAAAPLGLVQEQAALAGAGGLVSRRTAKVGNARAKYLPRILESHARLEMDGAVTDEFVQEAAAKLVKALEIYASFQRQDEAPDKYSRMLEKDARKVSKAIAAKDFPAVMAALETYRADIPGPPGLFKWSEDPVAVANMDRFKVK